MPFLGLHCTAGVCMKKHSGPPTPPPPPPAPAEPIIPKIPHSLYEPLAIGFLTLLVTTSFIVAGWSVIIDLRELRRKALSWEYSHGLRPRTQQSLPPRQLAVHLAMLDTRQDSGEPTEPLLGNDFSQEWQAGFVRTVSSGLSDVEDDEPLEVELNSGITEPAVLSWEGVSYHVFQVSSTLATS